MTTYFENRINNPENYTLDYGFDTLHILKKALDYQNMSLAHFNSSNDAESEDMKDMYWAMSCEMNERARGLLDAYTIITSREVINTTYAIKEEIEFVKEIIDITC